jgi:integrase/recombinase XerD
MLDSSLSVAVSPAPHALDRLVACAALDDAHARFLARSRSRATGRTYASDLRHFFRFLGVPEGIPTLEEIRAVGWRDVTAYRDRFFLPDPRTQRPALAPETGARRLSVISSFYEELRRAGVVAQDPARDVPRPRASLDGKTRGLAPEDVDRLFAGVERGTQRGERDLLLLAVLFFQWLRVAEAVRLRVEDLGEDAGIPTLTIRAKGGRERTIALRDEVATLACEYARRFEVEGFLFPALSHGSSADRPMTTEAARLIFKGACARAGLDARRLSPHSARVTGITTALVAGVPLDVAQDFAGHARAETTLRYHRARKRLLRAPVAALPFRLPASETSASSPTSAR